MSSAKASTKKIGGHKNESVFAELIGGELYEGLPTDKPDVVDVNGDNHSVKSGKFWQIFLYGRERFVSNTNFNEIGNLCPLFINCLDALPDTYDEYVADKLVAKARLQPAMRALLGEMKKENILAQFLQKGLFDGDAVLYLTISQDTEIDEQKAHHIFHRDDVISILSQLNIVNSKAVSAGQHNALKVLFKTTKNVGEIEIRTDSKTHYRRMKWRFNGELIFDFLCENLPPPNNPKPLLFTYGKGRHKSLAR